MRGINDRDKRLFLKNILRDWSCNLVCIQETKLEEVQLFDIRCIGGNQSMDFVTLKAQGSAGGIIVMWDKNFFNLVSSSCGDFLLLASSKWRVVTLSAPSRVSTVHIPDLTSRGCGKSCDV